MRLIQQQETIEQKYHDILIGNYNARVFYNHTTDIYETAGEKKYLVYLFKVMPESVNVYFFAAKREQIYITLPLKLFENRDPSFKDQIIATYNCHGFTLTDGVYFIDVSEATKIFEDEFEECSLSEANIIVFYDVLNTAQHSAKYLLPQRKLIDKQGVRPISCNSSIADIKNISEYSSLTEKFLKKKSGI